MEKDFYSTIKNKLQEINEDYEGSEVEPCLKLMDQKQSIIALINAFRQKLTMKLSQIKNFLKWFAENSDRKSKYQPTFYLAWISIIIYQQMGMKPLKAIQICFKHATQFLEDKNLSDWIQRISKEYNKGPLQEDQVTDIVQTIQKDQHYKDLLQLWENQKKNVGIDPNKTFQQSTKKELEQMEKDERQMPGGSFIKIIQKAMIAAFKNRFQFLNNGVITEIQLSPIKESLQKNSVFSRTIQADLEFIKNNKNKHNQVYSALLKIRTQLFPIFVPLLNRLIIKNQQAKEQVYNKSLILLIGKSGAGKSTIIFKCLGYQLLKGILKIGDSNLTTLEPKKPIKKQHQQIRSSPQQKSITSTVTAVKLARQFQKGKVQIYIADTPGLQDSGGFQIDLANGIGIINAIRNCWSVRPVLVISQQSWGDRSQIVKQLGKTVTGLFCDYESIQDSITWVFNKFSPEQISNLPGKCKNIEDTLTQPQKGDPQLMAFVKNLQRQVQDLNEMTIFHPFANEQDFKKNFIQKILSKSQISSPGKQFRYNFAQKTKQALNSLCQFYENLILRKFNSKQYKQSLYYLNHLKILSQKITNTYAQKSYQKIKQQLNQIVHKIKSKISNQIRNKIMNNCANKKTYQQIQSERQKLQQMRFFQNQLTIPKQYEIKDMFKEAEEDFINKTKEESGINLKETIKGVKLYIEFSSNASFQQNILDVLDKRMSNIELTVTTIIQNQQYSQIKNKYQEHLDLQQVLKIMNKSQDRRGDYGQDIRIILIKNINLYQTSINRQIPQNLDLLNIKDDSIDNINKTFKFLDDLISLNLPFLEQFNTIRTSLEDRFIDLVKVLCSKISSTLDQQMQAGIKDKIADKIKKYRQNAQQLTKIGYLSKYITIEVQGAITRIRLFIENSKQILQTMVAALKKNETHVIEQKILSISKTIERLQKLSQFENDQNMNRQIQDMIAYVRVGIQNYVNSIFAGFKAYKISLGKKQTQKYKDFIKKFIQINSLLGNKNKFGDLQTPNIQKIREDMKKIILKPIQQICKQMTKQGIYYKDIQSKLQKFNNFTDFIANLILDDDNSEDVNKEKQQLETKIKDSCKKILKQTKQQRIRFLNQVSDSHNANGEQKPQAIKKLKQSLVFYRKLFEYQNVCVYIFDDDFYAEKTEYQQVIKRLLEIKQDIDTITEENKLNNLGKQLLQTLIKNCGILKQLDSQMQLKDQQITFKDTLKRLQNFASKDYEQCLRIALDQIKLDTYQVDFSVLTSQWGNLNFGKHAKSQSFTKQINFKMIKLQKKFMTQFENVTQQLNHNINPQTQRKANNLFLIANNLIIKISELEQKHHLKLETIIQGETLAQSQQTLKTVLLEQYKQIKELIQKFKRKGLDEKIHQFSLIQRAIMKSKSKKILEDLPQQKFTDETPLSDLQRKQSRSKQLKILLQKKQRQIFEKYIPQSYTALIIDSELKLIYQNFTEEQKIRFKDHIQQFFNAEFQLYKEQYQKDEEIAQVRSKNIIQKINYLPAGLKKQQQTLFTKEVEGIKASVKNIVDDIRSQNATGSQILKNIKTNKNKLINQTWRKAFKQKIQKIFTNIKEQNDYNQKFKIMEMQFYDFYYVQETIIKQVQQCKNIFIIAQANIIRYFQQYFQKRCHDLKKQMKSNATDKVTTVSQTVSNYTRQIMTIGIKIKTIQNRLIHPQKIQLIITKFYQFVKNSINQYSETVKILNPQKLDDQSSDFNGIFKMKASILQLPLHQAIFRQIKNNLDQTKIEIAEQIIIQMNGLPEKATVLKAIQTKISKIISNMQKFELYNDQIKNYVSKNFKEHAFKLNNQLQKLEMLENSYKYNLGGTNRFDYQQLILQIQQAMKRTIQECQKQINQACKQYQKQISPKPNAVQQMIKAIDYTGVKGIKCADHIKTIPKTIKTNIQKLKNQSDGFIRQILSIKEQSKKQQDKSKATYEAQCAKIREDVEKIKNIKIQKKTEEAKTQIDTVEGKTQEQKDKKINQIQKKKDMEIQSIRKDAQNSMEQKIRPIRQHYTKIITANKQKRSQILKKLSLNFIILKKISVQLSIDSQENKKIVDKLTTDFQQKVKLRIVREMGQILEKLPQQYYPQILMSETKAFAINIASQWKQDVQGKDINYVLEKLNLDGQFSKKVRQSFSIYQTRFKQQIDTYSREPFDQTIDSLVIRTINLGKILQGHYFQNSPPVKGQKEQLLACIFALWAILKSEKDQNMVQYLYQPHPVQIVTLFLILGLNNQLRQQRLANRMAEVGTGQGKSVVLAGLSTYFSLVGYSVHCACYSQYLSGRDQQAFSDLFDRLSLTPKIKYGTFNDQCWDLLNSIASSSSEGRNVKFGELIKQTMLKQQSFLQKLKGIFGKNFLKFNNIDSSKKILIIDEVDVFFDPSFYGQILPSCISLTGQEVRNVLEMVWKRVKAGQRPQKQDIINTPQFNLLIKKYKPFEEVLKGQANGMISGAINYKHSYIVHEYRIVYKDQDAISTTMNFGYKTVFANCHQFQLKTISRQAYLQAMQIGLTVAQFSYALLPNFFDKIVGVTGTLFQIGQFYTNQLKDKYKVKDRYKMPSVYGQKRRVQESMIVPNDQFYQSIVNEIEDKKKNQRPSICFFRNIADMTDFYHSREFQPYKSDANTLSEQNDAYARDLRIKQATKAGQVTLMTASFGRGTDFKLYDKTVAEKGGLHIIHCYLSIQLSQEIQVKGRSARQGKKGSYTLVIPENEFQKIGFGVFAPGLVLGQHVQKHRKAKTQEIVNSIINELDAAQKKHNKTLKLFQTQNLTKKAIGQFLNDINKYPDVAYNSSKVILGIDATGSMGHALSNVKNVLATTFDSIYQILKTMGDSGSFQLQIVVYRNWNSLAHEILQVSSFESKVDNLKLFLKTVEPLGGWGNEALEVFFQHVNKQKSINQVILIGDAAANRSDQTKNKRQRRGQSYWNNAGFNLTTEQMEFRRVIQKRIPIHTFYIDAEHYFKKVSHQTGGISQKFDVHSARAAQVLTDFIAENILKKLGGERGDMYVDVYRKKYRPT